MRNIITVNGTRTKIIYSFQKDYEKWDKDKVTQLPVEVTPVTRRGNSQLPVEVPTKERKETIQKKEYGEFSNVLLSDDEYKKLTAKFNDSLDDKLEELSSAIASKGYKYKSHYATLLNWSRRKQVEAVGNHHKPREEWL